MQLLQMTLDLAAVCIGGLRVVSDLSEKSLDVRLIPREVFPDGGSEQLIDRHHAFIEQRGDVVDRNISLASFRAASEESHFFPERRRSRFLAS